MKQKLTLSAILLALAVVHGVAMADALPKFADGVLVDAKGWTLYTFDKDVTGKSNCNGGCTTAWPPAAVTVEDGASGEFSVVTRDDGTRQWAYQGRPLYRYSGDTKAGDVTGDKKGNVWHAVGADRGN